MRESFGGAFMIKVVLVFIVVYVSFMAVAVNYAKTFRVKNGIINILEQYQYSGNSNDTALEEIAKYLGSIPYNYSSQDIDSVNNCTEAGGEFITSSEVSSSASKLGGGYCLQKMSTTGSSSFYYKVTTYIVIDFPFFNLHFVLPISGETESMGDWRNDLE